MKTLLALAVSTISYIALAAPSASICVTPAIEAIDEVKTASVLFKAA